MSKTLRTAAIVVGAVALVVATAGTFAPVATASFLGSAGITAGTVAATTALATGLSLAATGLSLAAGLTAKKPSAADITGNPQEFAANPDAFIAYVIGRAMLAARIQFAGAAP